MSCMLCFYFFCNFTFFRVGGPISIFNVIDIKEGNDGYHKERFAYMVQYNDVEFDVRCSYYLFEFRSIICKHIANIMIEKNVKEIPSW